MNMKKIVLTLFIGILSIIIIPFSTLEAKEILSLNVTNNTNKLNVSGTAEPGVLAVAVLVYSEGSLVHMETCPSISNAYSCELSKTFEPGNYTVKVADYDGGAYVSKSIEVKDTTSSGEGKINNPQTSDNIVLYLSIGLMSIAGLIGSTITLKKRYN